jgi:hypothetical protein
MLLNKTKEGGMTVKKDKGVTRRDFIKKTGVVSSKSFHGAPCRFR